ncbi:MAG: hypothetical protein ABI763_06080 [Bacteroidota bacterium]
MKRSAGFLMLMLLLSQTEAFSQSIKSFTPDPGKFPQEMETFFTETNKKQGQELMDAFNKQWTGGKFISTQQEAIYRTANSMLRKRMKAFPDFANYISTLTGFSETGQPADRFDSWQQSLDKLLLLPPKNFTKYVDISNDLFRTNSLYVSAAVRWYSTSNQYKFEYDSLAKIIFPQMNLLCTTKGDSSVIYNTHGIYFPNREQFDGEGGNVNWIRAGWDEKTVHAELTHYSIDISKAEFTADNVSFFNGTYFNKPLEGKFTDKILANVTDANASYPKFESYTANFEIKNIVPDVDYMGGFSMIGNRMIGSSNAEQDARLIFYRDKHVFLVAGSKAFVVRKDKVTADNASITIYYGKDSIYHPGVEFKYIVKDRELALIRGGEGKNQSPCFDSYHNLDLFFDGLYWKIDDPIIDMKMISGVGESKAVFESSNFFRKNRFLKLQGLSEMHPMFIVKQYCEKHDTKVVYTTELAKEMRMAAPEVRQLLIALSNQGFVTYDVVEDKAVVKDRLYYYLLANTGKTDYDVIQFESVINAKPNASINLLNFEITMRGVSQIVLSDSQNVVIFPSNQEVHIQKNRDFTFGGRVKASRFDFYGKDFAFDYQNFKVNLNNVDSLRLKVEDDNSEVDEFGNKKLVYVRSVLENITGDLLIDFQGNKSGLKPYPQYPIFNSKKDSYVFYDRPYIQEGVYGKENFYFHLDPFTIDSLDNFSKAGLKFGGEFVSAGIFADFRDSLSLQPDLSLGLIRYTADNGWPAYGGKGTFTDKLSLSNDGLIGSGKIDYITSTSHSDRYIFLPDSMNADAKDFVNKKTIYANVEFPDVKAHDVYLHWMPKKDVMYVKQKTDPIDMFESQAVLAGNLQLKPSGLTGNGLMTFAASELESNLFRYKQNVFDADTSDFRLTSDNTNALAFSTNNVQAHIDFDKRVGDFKSNGGGSYVKFPLNQYICFIDQFAWYMDNKEIEMSSSSSSTQTVADTALSGLNLTGSEFISVEPTQDSLRFKAPHAKYSLRDYLIKADKVALIQTGDASVIPDSGIVVVERYAKMRTLNNARIVANNTTRYHTIYNASVNILGRKKYEGSGDYDYVDETNAKKHFHFEKITVDTTYQTVADAEINETEDFHLSPMFGYKGNVHLAASKQHLVFSGYAKPTFGCDSVPASWIRFTNEVDPENVMIPIESAVADNGDRLRAGVFQSQSVDSKGVYAAFLAPKNNARDSAMIDAKGFLTYNKPANEFRITTKEKMDKPNLPGEYVSLNNQKCIVYSEGKLNFGADVGQLKMLTAGNVTYNWNNDSTRLDLMMAMDFYFNEDALKNMSDYFGQNASLSPTADNGRLTYEKGLGEFAGKDKAEKLITEMNLYGAFKKMPDELRHTLFFTDVKMKWDKDARTFKSIGPIGLGSIDKTSVNKFVTGYIEIVHKRTGDVITVYLEPEKQTWFYFSYSRGVMQTLSTQTAFNDAINKLKPEKRVNKEKDKPDFEFMLTTDRAVKNFMKKFNAIPQQGEEEKTEEEK